MNGLVLGTVHFLQGTQKKKRLKRGGIPKNKGREGGVTQNILVHVQLT